MSQIRRSPSGDFIGTSIGANAAAGAAAVACPAATPTAVATATATPEADDTRLMGWGAIQLTKDGTPGNVTVKLRTGGASPVNLCQFVLPFLAAEVKAIPLVGGVALPTPGAATSLVIEVTSAAGAATADEAHVTWQSL